MQLANNKKYPTYSLDNMPRTDFSCRDKILGGYYADPDTQCQMFHVCVKVAGVGVSIYCLYYITATPIPSHFNINRWKKQKSS